MQNVSLDVMLNVMLHVLMNIMLNVTLHDILNFMLDVMINLMLNFILNFGRACMSFVFKLRLLCRSVHSILKQMFFHNRAGFIVTI